MGNMETTKDDQALKKLLVVDDDLELCELLTEFLEPEGFRVDSAHTGGDGLEKSLEGGYALIVLDVMLPGMNGFDVLRELRRQTDTPVLMLTAKGEEVDRIVGLEMGADDYLSKPFNPRELLARIRAIMRRAAQRRDGQPAGTQPVTVGDIVFDPASRSVHQDGREVPLTAAEFDLLGVLLKRAGSVVTREELTQDVLGRRLTPYDRSIDVHMSSLRRKLGNRAGDPERIRTIRGVGYQYAAPGSAGRPSPDGE
jgi:two-component system response regulator CpxR